MCSGRKEIYFGIFFVPGGIDNSLIAKFIHFFSQAYSSNESVFFLFFFNRSLIKRFMDELALAEVPQPTAEQGGSSSLQMQQVGTVQEKLSKNRDWDQVCVVVLGPEGFGAQTDATDNDLRRLVDNVYGLDGVDDVLSPEVRVVVGGSDVLLFVFNLSVSLFLFLSLFKSALKMTSLFSPY